jgi:hypothetical protein
MGNLIFNVYVLALVIVYIPMIPAVASQDTAAIEKAADQTQKQLINIGTKAMEEGIKEAPIEAFMDKLIK